MSAVEFLQAQVRSSLGEDTFVGPNTEKKVIDQKHYTKLCISAESRNLVRKKLID